MLREKWTWVAIGLIATLALTLTSIGQIARLSDRVSKLEAYLPYLQPTAQ